MEELRDQTRESDATQRLAIVETAYHPRTARRQGGGSVGPGAKSIVEVAR